jgi:phosphohistidine phosphatase
MVFAVFMMFAPDYVRPILVQLKRFPGAVASVEAITIRAMQFIIVRHANADWPNHQGPDFERPLTDRGFAEAHATAQAIVAAGHRPTLLLASSACRTRQTAEILAREFQLPAGAVRYVDCLYNASAATLEAVLRRAAAPGQVVVLVAHNPGVSDLARALMGDPAAPSCKPAEWRVWKLQTP